jgi:hypothetical protein
MGRNSIAKIGIFVVVALVVAGILFGTYTMETLQN